MKRHPFAFLMLFSQLFAGNVENAVRDIGLEIGQNKIQKEVQKIKRYKTDFSELSALSEKLYKNDKKNLLNYLNKINLIGKQTDSPVVAQFQVYEVSKLINVKDKEMFDKYLLQAAGKLYEKKLCDGFLFKGIYAELHEGDLLEAVKIYKEGASKCKINWKTLELLSRENRLKYRLGYFKK